jgi:adhesin transport system membrane fusion protein
VVNRIAITTIGGVLKPGETVMDLVPHNDGVVITARVRPEDIGFLSAGQMAKVRISAYDASVFGSLDGVVRRVGADALQDERKEMYFEVQIETSNWLKDKQGKPLNVLSGMTADVSIRTGERTILEYMLKPIVKVLDTSLKER